MYPFQRMKGNPSPVAAATANAAVLSKLRGHSGTAFSVVILFSVGYVLGFLSNSSAFSSSPQFPSAARLPSPPPPLQPSTTSEQSHKTSLELPQPLPPPHDLLRFRTQCAVPVPPAAVLKKVLDEFYNGTSPYEGFPSPATAELLLPPASNPRGWGSTMPVFRDLITAVRPLTIIELGTFLGASALHMAAVTANLSLPTTILCVDDFRGWPGFQRRFHRDVPRSSQGDSLLLHQFMAGVKAAGEERRVLPLPFSTGSAMAALCEWGVYGDLIEVDAGHDFHSAWADINRAYAVLRPGGVLFGHDYFTMADDRGVRRAVTLFAKTNRLQVRAHGQHWVLSPKPATHTH